MNPLDAVRCPGCGHLFRTKFQGPGEGSGAKPGLLEHGTTSLPRKPIAWWWLPLIALAFTSAGFVAYKRLLPRPTAGTLASTSLPSPGSATIGGDEPDVTGGIFTASSQKEQEPTISIGNGTGRGLVFVLIDSAGTTRTESVPAFSSKEFSTSEGSYNARVESSDIDGPLPDEGTVDVKDFHHYDASFVAGDTVYQEPFHIGD